MAERKRQPKLECQFEYQFDRHAAEKMAQVYRWLSPVRSKQSQMDELSPCPQENDEKDRGHLRASLL